MRAAQRLSLVACEIAWGHTCTFQSACNRTRAWALLLLLLAPPQEREHKTDGAPDKVSCSTLRPPPIMTHPLIRTMQCDQRN